MPLDAKDLPHADDAEMALLGALLHSNRSHELVAEFLRPEHFASRVHGKIYEAIARKIERGDVADPITLKAQFEGNADLAEIGGYAYLIRLAGSIASGLNVGDYGRTIHDLYLRRELIAFGQDIVAQAMDGQSDETAMQIVDGAETRLYGVSDVGDGHAGPKPLKATMQATVAAVDKAWRNQGVVGMPTGYAHLDRLLGGLQDTDLLILAGRPGMGKSSLAVNIATNVARWINRRIHSGEMKRGAVAVFSLEMSTEQVERRELSRAAGIDHERINRGEIDRYEFDRIQAAAEDLEGLPLHIDQTPAITPARLRLRARRMKRRHGLSLIVVDYLQLMQPDRMLQGSNRVQHVSDITAALKQIAKELQVPVIALSQLSRAVELRDDKRPQLSDLRDSGSIEQDADVVMFVYRDEYYLAKQEPQQKAEEDDADHQQRWSKWRARMTDIAGVAEVIVAKYRHGATGTVKLHFNGPTISFATLGEDGR